MILRWRNILPSFALVGASLAARRLAYPRTGLIVADRYGGAIIRPSTRTTLHASRRKAVTLSFAKVAAERLAAILESVAQGSSSTMVIPDADQS